jgi:hypothetical protein
MAALRAAQANSASADGGPAECLVAGSTPEPVANTIERAAVDLRRDISCANCPAEDDYATPVPVPAHGVGATTFFYSHDRDIIRAGKAETAQQYLAGPASHREVQGLHAKRSLTSLPRSLKRARIGFLSQAVQFHLRPLRIRQHHSDH